METSHEYDMALLTAMNHGEAHEFLQQQCLVTAIESLFRVLIKHHLDITYMDRQRVIIETLSYWQRTFDNPDCDE